MLYIFAAGSVRAGTGEVISANKQTMACRQQTGIETSSHPSFAHVDCLTVVSRYAALYAIYGVCFLIYLSFAD